MFTFIKTATSDLRQLETVTNVSSNINLQLALRYRYTYRRRHYVMGSGSYDSVMHMAPGALPVTQPSTEGIK